MKRRQLLTLISAIIFSSTLFSQQALFGGTDITSPEINPDNSVTFRFQAPDAREVKISGDWMPMEGWKPGSQNMTKDEKGVWSYESSPLEEDLHSYSFIADGIRCTDPNNVFLIRDVATVSNIFIVGSGKADLYRVKNVPHGSVTRRWYSSGGLGITRRITIYTPPGYENSREKYPVLYLLHGMGGDEEAWINLGRTSQILDNLISQGKAKPMIVVMPNGNVVQEAAPGESSSGFAKPTMQLPNTMDGKYEETFGDIIKFIEGNYRAKTDKSARAIAGLSMGGFHSLYISANYPDTFDYVGLFSAAIIADPKNTSPIYSDIDNKLSKQSGMGYRLYWIGIGKTDFLYRYNVDFRKRLDDLKMKYKYRESEGGHTWSNWRVYLSEFVPELF